jgi:L-alanine-DL-glutamate epimerase-like enolase superfamily enzyme
MKIKSVRLYELRIPFKFNITHNLKTRRQSYSIIVEIVTADGSSYYGEGCPREYVIDEPKEKTISSFEKIAHLIDDHSYKSIDNIKALSDKISDQYGVPSLACAFSIALLDMYSTKENIPIYKILSLESSDHPLCPYSGVLSTTDPKKFRELLSLIKKLDLPHVKLKAGHDAEIDNIKLAREVLGYGVDIRIDGNRVWTLNEAIEKIPQYYEYKISGIEEPLIASQIDQLPELSRHIDIPIILDESVCNMTQAQFYIDNINHEKLRYNLKISKLGGPLRASEVYQLSSNNNISCMLGCNVGESAILSYIGRSFAQAHRLNHLEGSYAPFFMESDISVEPFSFGKRGLSDRIESTGLGLQMDKNKMQAFFYEKSKIVK